MSKYLFLIIVMVLFLPSVSAQEISVGDTKDAIISAIEFSNDVSVKFNLRHTYPSKNTVKVYSSLFNDEVASDSFIDELNRNQSGIVFYKSHKAFYKKNKKIDSSWLIVKYHKVDSNIVVIYMSDCWYNKKMLNVNPDVVCIVCRKSSTTCKWHIAHEFFIPMMFHNFSETDYYLLTKQLYNNLQNGQLETETDYMLLFNYFREQDESEYYPKIKELLKCMISENPEINERVQTYLYMIQESGYGYVFDEIEQNYNKILN